MSPIRNRLLYRLHLELVEDRLPPGDVLLGILMGMAALPDNPVCPDLTTNTAAKRSILSPNLLDDFQAPLGSTKPASATVRHRSAPAATDNSAKVQALEDPAPVRVSGVVSTASTERIRLLGEDMSLAGVRATGTT